MALWKELESKLAQEGAYVFAHTKLEDHAWPDDLVSRRKRGELTALLCVVRAEGDLLLQSYVTYRVPDWHKDKVCVLKYRPLEDGVDAMPHSDMGNAFLPHGVAILRAKRDEARTTTSPVAIRAAFEDGIKRACLGLRYRGDTAQVVAVLELAS